MYDEFKLQLNRVAETQFVLRPILVKALKSQVITDEGRKFLGDFANYEELWASMYSDRFFDMATLIRLGSAIEGCLKWYYMSQKGYANLLELKADSAYKKGIFQRIQPLSEGVIILYQSELGYDLTTNPYLLSIQEAMMHCHLYAHNSGLLDDDYIKKIKEITGQDIMKHSEVISSYPNNDTYWFEPLKRTSHFIEEAKRFFDNFP